MPTITTVDVSWETSSTLDAAELRRLDTAMFLGDGSNNGVRGGIVRHGDFSLIASINGSDQVTVQSGTAVIPAATGLGVYRVALSAATTATAIDPRNATNPRIDLVVFRSTGALDIITGTPGASPSAPALPANAIEVGRINIPAVGGGAATVSHLFRAYATALGGTIQVESASRLPGSGNQKGQRAVSLDTGSDYRWNGTTWIPQGVGVDYTPIVGGLLATGTNRGRYVRNGQMCTVRFSVPATGTAASAIEVSLPFPARNPDVPYGPEAIVGVATGRDTGTAYHTGAPLALTSATTVAAYERNGVVWGAGVPHAWASGDMFSGVLTYEVADGS